MRHRILARYPRDVIAQPGRHLGDLQMVTMDLNLGTGDYTIAIRIDCLGRLPPAGSKTTLGVSDHLKPDIRCSSKR